MILIGSQALHIHEAGKFKPDSDYDIICTRRECFDFLDKQSKINSVYASSAHKLIAKITNKIYEFELITPFNVTKNLSEKIYSDPNSIEFGEFTIPSIDVLYKFKMSHRFLKNSPHFNKTRKDILYLREKYGCLDFYEDGYKELFEQREKETLNYSHPKLNALKKDFFSEQDRHIYKYDHDQLHEIVKLSEIPAYQYFKCDEHEVLCSKKKWDAIPTIAKIYAVIEEAYVLALERSQIPFAFNLEPKKSFLIALEKICTSITSGWFREFSWEYYDDVVSIYDASYVNKFKNAVLSGKILPIDKQ